MVLAEDLAGVEVDDGDGGLVDEGEDAFASVLVADAEVVHAGGAAQAGLAVCADEKGEATPESMYGRRKMTARLRRQGLPVSRRRVDRLMRQLGVNGLVRGKTVRTTIPDRNAERAPDLLGRRLHLCPDVGGVRLCHLRYRLLLTGNRGLAGRDDEDNPAGDHRVADGPVAARSRRSPDRGRADPSQRRRLPGRVLVNVATRADLEGLTSPRTVQLASGCHRAPSEADD